MRNAAGEVLRICGSIACQIAAPLRFHALITAASPLHRVQQTSVPFLLIHGDADKLVPLSHSQKLVDAISKSGGKAELIIKAGGGHPWLTIAEEVAVMADWFDKQLAGTD